MGGRSTAAHVPGIENVNHQMKPPLIYLFTFSTFCLMASYDWRVCPAGLMAIGEGTGKVRFDLLVRWLFMNIPEKQHLEELVRQVFVRSIRRSWARK